MASVELQPAINLLLAKRSGIDSALAVLGYSAGNNAVVEIAKKADQRAPARAAEQAPRAKRGELRDLILKLIRKKGPIRASKLADITGKEQSNIIVTCSRLVEANLITKNEDKEYEIVEQADAEDDDVPAKAPKEDDGDDEPTVKVPAGEEYSDDELAKMVEAENE